MNNLSIVNIFTNFQTRKNTPENKFQSYSSYGFSIIANKIRGYFLTNTEELVSSLFSNVQVFSFFLKFSLNLEFKIGNVTFQISRTNFERRGSETHECYSTRLVTHFWEPAQQALASSQLTVVKSAKWGTRPSTNLNFQKLQFSKCDTLNFLLRAKLSHWSDRVGNH